MRFMCFRETLSCEGVRRRVEEEEEPDIITGPPKAASSASVGARGWLSFLAFYAPLTVRSLARLCKIT